jgi:integrase
MTNPKLQRKDVVSDMEIEQMLATADAYKDPFFRLRAKAVLGLLATGKRRFEIVSLEQTDLETDATWLYVTFTVTKKRKKNILSVRRTKKFRLTSRWAKMILEYAEFLKRNHPNCKWLFPSGRTMFGQAYLIDQTKHAHGQEVWRIIKKLNPNDWPHLHREKRAVKVIRADEAKYGEANMETIYRVKSVLDLERETTAYNYVRRHETQKVEEEEETEIE